MKCAAIPKIEPPSNIQSGGVIPLEIAIDEGRAANAIAYGRGEKAENLK